MTIDNNSSTPFLIISSDIWTFFWRKQFASQILEEINPPGPHFAPNAHFNRQKGISVHWGLLRPPLYQRNSEQFSLYGSLGFVVGHELMHLISYFTRIFRATGERPNFLNDTACFVKSYGRFCFNFDSKNQSELEICADGARTLEENLADVEGLRLAFRAFQETAEGKGMLKTLLKTSYGKFTNEQLFFLSFGARYCSHSTKDAFLKQLTDPIDPHSADPVRVNGAVSNLPEFSSAFHCPAENLTNSSQKCTLFKINS